MGISAAWSELRAHNNNRGAIAGPSPPSAPRYHAKAFQDFIPLFHVIDAIMGKKYMPEMVQFRPATAKIVRGHLCYRGRSKTKWRCPSQIWSNIRQFYSIFSLIDARNEWGWNRGRTLWYAYIQWHGDSVADNAIDFYHDELNNRSESNALSVFVFRNTILE